MAEQQEFLSRGQLEALNRTYRDALINDTMAFWFPRAVDTQNGGYFTCLNRDGELLQTDKSVWFQGRMAWMLATVYLNVEQDAKWLEWAQSGIEFIEQHCFDADGRMFFSVTAEGKPLRKRRYQFSETFAIIAFAAYGTASGKPQYIDKAEALLRQIVHNAATPGVLEPKTNPETRPMKGLAWPMILLVTAQELRKHRPSEFVSRLIDDCIDEIQHFFVKPQLQCVLETVGANGEFIDTFEGRCINPGHSIEAAWFLLEEARLRDNDPRLLELGTQIIDWSLRIGWDETYGGIYYFRDAKGLPCTEYWHDMKFWWPHNEAVIATLLAYELTGEERYAQWHAKIHAWNEAHFPDPEHGEWYGYLHRDGTLSTPVKGTMYKGCFHLPRMQLLASEITARLLAK